MIAPAPLRTLIAGTRIEAAKAAIVARLGSLLPGVAVAGHPGKLDINDVLAKAIVSTPGIAVGYARVRPIRDPGGTFTLAVDWVAYVVVEDWVDTGATPPRRVSREAVAHAVGLQLLRILGDPDTASWGLPAIDAPSAETPPELRPVFTMKTAEEATAVYAVTWSQGLVQEGAPWFGFGGTPGVQPSDGFPDDDTLDFDLPDGELPPEILAHIGSGS